MANMIEVIRNNFLFISTILASNIASQSIVLAVGCPSYGCVPGVMKETITINGFMVKGKAAGIQYYNSFVVNCKTGNYTAYYPVGTVSSQGNIYQSKFSADHVMASTIALSCPYQYLRNN